MTPCEKKEEKMEGGISGMTIMKKKNRGNIFDMICEKKTGGR